MKNISDELKIYELSLIWREAEYNFAFWDIRKDLDWDLEYKKAIPRVLATNDLYEYYLELMKFISLLKDGHTGVWFPKEIETSDEYTSKLPVTFKIINNEIVIFNIKKAVQDKIKPYSIIRKINRIPVWEYINNNIYPYIWHENKKASFVFVNKFLRNGPLNSEIELEIEYNNQISNVTLTRTKGDGDWASFDCSLNKEQMKEVYKSQTHRIDVTNDDIVVITIDSFMNDDFYHNILNNYSLLKNYKAYIIDIRHNGGGSSNNGDALASLFIGKKFTNQKSKSMIHIGCYKAWGLYSEFDKKSYNEVVKERGDNEFVKKTYQITNKEYFEEQNNEQIIDENPGTLNGPVVVLTSEETASAAEDFTAIMKEYPKCTIIGSPTFGSTGQPITIHLESGGGFRVCTRHGVNLDGSEFINIGILPHINLELTIDDYKNQIDSVFNKALEVIRNKTI